MWRIWLLGKANCTVLIYHSRVAEEALKTQIYEIDLGFLLETGLET